MNIFKTLDMATIEEKDTEIKKLQCELRSIKIHLDEQAKNTLKRVSDLSKQARKSICESCVSMTNQAHNQDYIIEDLTDKLERAETALKAHQICDKQILIDSLIPENNFLRCELEKSKDRVKQLESQAEYYLKSWDSTRQDLAMIQRFVKGIGQANLYGEIFKMEQSK